MGHEEQRRIDAGHLIDLKWLRSFVVVAEEASFTRLGHPGARGPAGGQRPGPAAGVRARPAAA
jgi:hypothetical protein